MKHVLNFAQSIAFTFWSHTKNKRDHKHYHPLLEKEKKLKKTVHRIFPDQITRQLYQKSSRLAHLNGLPKAHKPKLSMRPILSAAGTQCSHQDFASWGPRAH